jgi:hypothetical protein
MKLVHKYSIPLLVGIACICFACERFSGGGESITGTYHCNESGQGYRSYSVSIDKAGVGFDSTYFIVYNFHNLGFDFETYIRLRDTIITFTTNNQGYNISGNGYYHEYNNTIDWNYSITGSNANDFSVRALYIKQ